MSELDNATRAAVLTVAMAAAEDVEISGYLGEFQISYMNGGYELLFKDALREAQNRCDGERGLTFVFWPCRRLAKRKEGSHCHLSIRTPTK